MQQRKSLKIYGQTGCVGDSLSPLQKKYIYYKYIYGSIKQAHDPSKKSCWIIWLESCVVVFLPELIINPECVGESSHHLEWWRYENEGKVVY